MSGHRCFLLGCVIVFFASSLQGDEPNRHEWPQYRGNSGFTGLSTDASVKPPLKLFWSHRLDGDASGDAGSGVVVAGGKVFSPVHNTRSIVTLDAHTGEFLWEFRDPANSYVSVPTYHDGRLIVWQRGKAKEFTILALDARDGSQQWRHTMRAEQSDRKRVGLPVSDGKVYCTEGGPDAAVFALDVETGREVWRSPLGTSAGTCVVTPSVAGGMVFTAVTNSQGFRQGTDGAVMAFDAATGKPLWQRPGIFPQRTLASDGKSVVCAMFASNDTKGYLLDAKSGQTLWTSAPQFHYNPATIAGDLVLMRPYGAGCQGYDLATGKKQWDFQIPKVASGCCAPSVSGQFAYFGTGVINPGDLEAVRSFQHVHAPREQGISGTMHAIDLATGKSVWQFSTANCICGDPAIAYGRLYFTSRDGMVYCFTPAKQGESTTPESVDLTQNAPREVVEALLTQNIDPPANDRDWIMQGGTPDRAGGTASLPAKLELAWTLDTGDRVATSAAGRDGRAFIGSDAGQLLAIEVSSGRKLWEHAMGGRIRCTPAVAADAVYCGSDTGQFGAFDPQTGKLKWLYTAGGPIQASPTIVGGLVLFAANDHHVYALDRATGKKAWSKRLNDYAILSAPVVHGRQVFVAQWNDWVWALDLATGHEQWKAFIPITIEGLAWYRDKLYVRNPNYLVQIEPSTGQREVLSYASWGWGGMAFVDGRLFSSGIQSQYGTSGATVVNLDDPGEPLKQEVPTLEGARLRKSSQIKNSTSLASMTTPLALTDKLCFAPVSGALTLTSLDGGKLWSFDLGGGCHASPIATHGHLIVGCDDGKVYAFRPESNPASN